ncbi:MAG: EamA family transporter, partial [Thiolinea sp.]
MYLLAIFLGLCSALIWGAHSSVSMLGINAGWTSFDLNATRVAGGLLVSLPWLLWRLLKQHKIPWLRLLGLTCFAGVPFSLINIAGLQFAPITHGAAISLGMAPVLAGLFSKPILGQAISRDHWLALLLIMLGIAVIWLCTSLSWSY